MYEAAIAAVTARVAPRPTDWLAIADLPLPQLLAQAALMAPPGPASMTPHAIGGTVWQRTSRRGAQDKGEKGSELHGHENAMRVVLWLVAMYWAAMVWDGRCVLCSAQLSSWQQHCWVSQVPRTCTTTIAKLIDWWRSYDSDCLLYLLPHFTLACTIGQTGCGRKVVLTMLFGSERVAQPAGESDKTTAMLLCNAPVQTRKRKAKGGAGSAAGGAADDEEDHERPCVLMLLCPSVG